MRDNTLFVSQPAEGVIHVDALGQRTRRKYFTIPMSWEVEGLEKILFHIERLRAGPTKCCQAEYTKPPICGNE